MHGQVDTPHVSWHTADKCLIDCMCLWCTVRAVITALQLCDRDLLFCRWVFQDVICLETTVSDDFPSYKGPSYISSPSPALTQCSFILAIRPAHSGFSGCILLHILFPVLYTFVDIYHFHNFCSRRCGQNKSRSLHETFIVLWLKCIKIVLVTWWGSVWWMLKIMTSHRLQWEGNRVMLLCDGVYQCL
jgi:hypothetical protein